ncbi:MAG: leucine-rich repeat protein [Anaeroplasmataceae bacterium]|nr:leucine-rich repeat protein [Anaeroplasmataceae bacterium]
MAFIILCVPLICLSSCTFMTTKYTVTYDAGEGEFANGASIVKQKIARGGKLDTSLIPSRLDYEFVYWTESGSRIEINSYTVYMDITLTAIWRETSNEYPIYSNNFYSDSGHYIIVEKDVDSLNLEPEISCGENSIWEIENVEGKVVTNLQPGNNYFTIVVSSEHKVRTQKHAINVHRKHDIQISYQVDENEVFVDTVLSGELYTPKDDVDIFLPGYRASEWRRKGKIGTTFIPLEDTVLETTPTPQAYTITFDGNGADYLSREESIVSYMNSFQLPTVTREGYTFKGWYYGEEYLGGTYTTVQWNIPSNATLVAKWEVLQERLSLRSDTFAAGTASGGGLFDYGTKAKVTATLNSGYAFLGWYTDNSKNEFLSNELEYEVEVKGVNLVARYQKFNLTATANYGDVIVPDKGVVGQPIVLRPATQSLQGLSFDGWYLNKKKVSSDFEYEFEMPKQATAYEARWTNPDLEIFNLEVTETTCKIVGLKDGVQPTSLMIPDVVTEIGNYAFSSNSSLYRVTIGDGVTTIGRLAFSNCTSLVEIVIGNHVTEMNSAIYNCRKLVEIKNTSNCEINNVEVLHLYSTGNSKVKYDSDFIYYIDEEADIRYVMGYIGFDSTIVLPESIDGKGYEVYAHAFRGMDIVEDITIPASVSAIGAFAFRGCSNLVRISYNATNIRTVATDTFAKESSADTSKKIQVFIGKNVESIPDNLFNGSVTLNITQVNFEENTLCSYIGSYAFRGLGNLSVISIPKSVRTIGKGAFDYCVGATEIHYLTNQCEIEDYFAFSSVGQKGTGVTLYIGPDITMIPYKFMFASSSGTKPNIVEVVIESEILSEIGYSAFNGVIALRSFSVPASVTKIGYGAFVGCTGMIQFEYNAARLDQDNSVGLSLFNNMGSASGFDLTIGEQVISIPNQMFYTGSMNSIVFSPNGVLTEIGSFAFQKATKIKEVVIPDSVISMGNSVFAECSALQSVTIGTGIQTIGTGAFDSCALLENIYWNAVEAEDGCVFTTIGASAKNGVTVTFGNDVKRIPGELFSSAAKLKTMNFSLNPSVIEIGKNAFKNVSTLTSVILPRSVQRIEEGAFSGCTGLASLSYQAEELQDFTEYRAFSNAGVSGGMIVVIGSNVKRIPAYLFASSDETMPIRISAVSFEKNNCCIEIGDYAFSVGTKLKSIILADSIETIGVGAFSNITEIESLTIGINTTTLGNDVFKDTIIKELNWNAAQCQDFTMDTVCLQNVNILSFGEKVKRVPAYLAYENSSAIFSVKFTADGMCTSIGEYAFYQTKLRQMNYPSTLLEIGAYAFYGSLLKVVTLPDSVSEVGEYAFAQCIALVQVKLSNAMTIVKNGTFQGSYVNGNLTDVTLSNNLIEIGEYAFADNRNLKSITFPATLTKIGSYAFYRDSSLTSLTIPASVRVIEEYAFYRCSNVKNVVFENPGSIQDSTKWMANGEIISKEILKWTDLAATYLCVDYVEYKWIFTAS